MKNFHFRKTLSAALALTLTLTLTACGGEKDPTEDKSNNDEKTYKVGIVKLMDHASLDQIERKVQAQLDAKSEELGVSDGVDVVIPIATPAAQVMQSVVLEEGIPIIFAAVSDPVTAKLVDSLEAPGGMITGVSDALNTEMIMELMRSVDPDIQKVGLLYSKSEDSSKRPIEEAKAYLDAKGIAYEERTGTNTDEINSAVDGLISAGVEAIFTPTDNTVMSAELSIFEKLNDAKIPHYTGANSFALNGAFFGYGVDYDDLGAETANMVVDLLVNGADPASTPVVILAHEAATINTETCQALGMTIDQVEKAFGTLGIGVVEITTAQSFEN